MPAGLQTWAGVRPHRPCGPWSGRWIIFLREWEFWGTAQSGQGPELAFVRLGSHLVTPLPPHRQTHISSTAFMPSPPPPFPFSALHPALQSQTSLMSRSLPHLATLAPAFPPPGTPFPAFHYVLNSCSPWHSHHPLPTLGPPDVLLVAGQLQ